MQFTLAAITALFAATSALALPAGAPQTPPTSHESQIVRITFANDLTGFNSFIEASLDGELYQIPAGLTGPGTGICSEAGCFATSAYWNSAPPSAFCAILNASGEFLHSFSETQTYVDLDGNPSAAQPVSLAGYQLRCE